MGTMWKRKKYVYKFNTTIEIMAYNGDEAASFLEDVLNEVDNFVDTNNCEVELLEVL